MGATSYEREYIAADLRGALEDAQVNQETFARLLGTSRTRLSAYLGGKTMPSAAVHQRALRTAAGLKSARIHGWMTPDHTADQINQALAADDEAWALKLIMQARDHLAEMLRSGEKGSDAWLVRGRQVADPRYDALLAAIVDHEFEEADRQPRPEWTKLPRLDVAWTQPNARWGENWTRQHTPHWLAKRGIYIADRDLMTA